MHVKEEEHGGPHLLALRQCDERLLMQDEAQLNDVREQLDDDAAEEKYDTLEQVERQCSADDVQEEVVVRAVERLKYEARDAPQRPSVVDVDYNAHNYAARTDYSHDVVQLVLVLV